MFTPFFLNPLSKNQIYHVMHKKLKRGDFDLDKFDYIFPRMFGMIFDEIRGHTYNMIEYEYILKFVYKDYAAPYEKLSIE